MIKTNMEIQSENENLKKRIAKSLLVWGVINIITGIFFIISSSELINGILTQAFLWGIIDAIIGFIAFFSKKELSLEKIKKILLINVYLDIVYMIGGFLLALFGNNTYMIGNGFGVIIQGLFLFVFDLLSYIQVKNML